jgi:hypothetical protein
MAHSASVAVLPQSRGSTFGLLLRDGDSLGPYPTPSQSKIVSSETLVIPAKASIKLLQTKLNALLEGPPINRHIIDVNMNQRAFHTSPYSIAVRQ